MRTHQQIRLKNHVKEQIKFNTATGGCVSSCIAGGTHSAIQDSLRHRVNIDFPCLVLVRFAVIVVCSLSLFINHHFNSSVHLCLEKPNRSSSPFSIELLRTHSHSLILVHLLYHYCDSEVTWITAVYTIVSVPNNVIHLATPISVDVAAFGMRHSVLW